MTGGWRIFTEKQGVISMSSRLEGKIPQTGGLYRAAKGRRLTTQGGKVSGSLVVMPTGHHPTAIEKFWGKGSGPLNEAPSILSRVPSKTCLPCLGTLPPSFVSPDSSIGEPGDFQASFVGQKKNPAKGLTAEATFRMVALPMTLGMAAKTPQQDTEKCLTARSECPRLINPPRDEAL